eukprot:scaffold26645_cov150-Skeletonema_menzelii.AAC.11
MVRDHERDYIQKKRTSCYNITSWETPSSACSNRIEERSRNAMLVIVVVFCMRCKNVRCSSFMSFNFQWGREERGRWVS